MGRCRGPPHPIRPAAGIVALPALAAMLAAAPATARSLPFDGTLDVAGTVTLGFDAPPMPGDAAVTATIAGTLAGPTPGEARDGLPGPSVPVGGVSVAHVSQPATISLSGALTTPPFDAVVGALGDAVVER